MPKKYKNQLMGSVVLLTALIELSMGAQNKIQQKSMIMDKFLTNDITITNEDISFDTKEDGSADIIGEYSLLTQSYSHTTALVENSTGIDISSEKVADPSQRYRDVDEYLYVNRAVDIYKEDKFDAEVLKQAEFGDYVHKIGNDPYHDDGFSKIEIDGNAYYIETQALTSEILFKERNQTVYALEDLTVYAELELITPIDSVSYIHGIQMVGESNDLVKVIINERAGYISKSKISKEMLFIDNSKKVWTLYDLNLKAFPSEDAETVKTIYKYDSLQQLGTSQAWSKLETANGTIVYAKTENFTDVRPISKGEEIARYAQQFVGNPYVYGGTSLTNGADCSGFVQTIYKHFGYSLNRTASTQRSNGRRVSYDSARPGDLIFYSGHVAIYIGNGQIVHASNSAPYPRGGIKISSATYNTIVEVRRIVD